MWIPSTASRREFLKALAIAASTPLLPAPAFSLGNAMVGGKTIHTVSDGNLVQPSGFMFPGVPQDELKAILEAHGMDTETLKPDCNVTVMRDGERVVVFDVGAGPNFMPSTGKLPENLADAGIDPVEVTDVVFTHAHPDHIWGLVDDFDELLFPEANYHISRTEWDFWRADDTLTSIPEARKTFVIGARNRFDYLEERISLFEPGAEVVSGVEAIDTSGHTPGHTSFAIHDGSQSLVVIGDAIINVAVSLARPQWPSGSDQDPEKGAKTRVQLLDRLATDKSRIVGFHMPHPGIGVVERSGTAFKFAVEG